jgi:2'-5' RNA ligase
MPVAVVLRLDASTAGFIDAMAESLPDRRSGDRNRSYPPHLTLAIFSDSVDAADLDAALAATTGRWKALPVTLAGIGVFPGDPSLVWLAPAPTDELLARHATLRRALADLPYHPEYDVGAWVPHVTLARTHLLPDAVGVLASAWSGSITGWLDSLDLIRLRPAEILSRRPLNG